MCDKSIIKAFNNSQVLNRACIESMQTFSPTTCFYRLWMLSQILTFTPSDAQVYCSLQPLTLVA